MKIEFIVPDGDSCKDCPYQTGFGIEEMDMGSLRDDQPYYVRKIVAACRLFNETISGISLDNMQKCIACARWLNRAQKG